MGKLIGTSLSLAALTSMLLSAAVMLPDDAQAKDGQRRGSRMVSGEQGLDNLNRLLTEVPWYTRLAYAQKKAAKEDKPIFWVHMLGPMNGAT